MLCLSSLWVCSSFLDILNILNISFSACSLGERCDAACVCFLI